MTDHDRARLIEALRSGRYQQARYGVGAGVCVADVAVAIRVDMTASDLASFLVMNDELGLSFAAIADRLEIGHLSLDDLVKDASTPDGHIRNFRRLAEMGAMPFMPRAGR
jgi:hypothetical protein